MKRSATTIGALAWIGVPVRFFRSQDLKTSPILPGVIDIERPER